MPKAARTKGLPEQPKPKRNEQGRFSRSYSPVAKVRVYKEPEPYQAVSGRHGIDWEELGKGLEHRAQYDPASMAMIREAGGIAAFVRKSVPFLDGERMQRLIQNIEKIAHAKQRAYKGDNPLNAARRLSKKEKRKKRKTRLEMLIAEAQRNKR